MRVCVCVCVCACVSGVCVRVREGVRVTVTVPACPLGFGNASGHAGVRSFVAFATARLRFRQRVSACGQTCPRCTCCDRTSPRVSSCDRQHVVNVIGRTWLVLAIGIAPC